MDFFQQVKFSITNVKMYDQLSKLPFIKTFLYLFFFSSLIWILSYAGVYLTMNKGIEGMKEKVIEEIPDFKFFNGRLEVSGAMPVILYKDLASIVIVDTSGNTKEDVLNSYRSGIYISADKLDIKGEDGRVEHISFANFSGISFTKDHVISWLPYLDWIYFIVGAIYYIYTILSYLVNALWMSLLGLILGLILKVKTSFSSLYKIGVYALTLPMILNMVLSYMTISLYSLLFYLIAAVYVGLALFEMSKTEEVEITL